MSNQPRNFVLGTPKKEFSSQTLRNLLYSAKSFKELAPAKKYLISYFARGEIGVYKWLPKKQIFKHYHKKDACDSFTQSDLVEFTNDRGEVIGRFNIQKWFYRDTPFFSLEVNPYQPKIYRDPEDSGYYINQFHGFLHPNPPPFHEFSQEVRDRVKLVLNHMNEVLCSSNDDQAYYMRNLAMRIAIGQKMQKTMFLYSGPGTGKTMLTWFLRRMVLGPKITVKKANEGVITGQFNKELEGKCLLVLEEMSNSKSVDWITFANRLKDFIDSDTLWIEEKHKTGYEVTNITNLIINSNNSKTIRLDKNDRRYFIPDISEKYVENGTGMDSYYDPLDRAMRNPEVGKAFYSYALEYVRLNPNFNERKIPMTQTKLMMITRDNNIIHEYIKQEFICKSRDIEVASSYFYSSFKTWYSEQPAVNNKKPPTIQEFTRALKGLGLEAKQKRIGDRKAGKRLQWYSASFNDLYTTFLKKNMIDEAENIVEPEGYEHNENKYTHPVERFPEEPKDLSAPSAVEKNEESKPEPKTIPPKDAPRAIPKKTPPPLPPKPDHLKRRPKSSNPEVAKEEVAPEAIDPASIPLPESPKIKPALEEPESVEPMPDPEPYGIPGPSNSGPGECEEMPEECKEIPEPQTTYFDENLEELYKSVKEHWASDDNDPEEFDWEVLALEMEDLEKHRSDPINDLYHHQIRASVRAYQYKLNLGLDCPPYKVIADSIRAYENERGRPGPSVVEEQRDNQIPPEDSKIVLVKEMPVYSIIDGGKDSDQAEADEDSELDEIWGD